jgi:ABC-type multidrug transport system permease subunit
VESLGIIDLVLLSIAVGCLLLVIPLGLWAYHLSPWRRKKAKRKKAQAQRATSSPSMLARICSWVKIVTVATAHATLVSLVIAVLVGLPIALAGIPGSFGLIIASSIGLIVGVVVFASDAQEASVNLKRRGIVTLPKQFFPIDLFDSIQSTSASSSSDELLPSGYLRSDYRSYGATDEDIEFWGFDQPGAPPPDVAGWAVMELLEEMDQDGDEWW